MHSEARLDHILEHLRPWEESEPRALPATACADGYRVPALPGWIGLAGTKRGGVRPVSTVTAFPACFFSGRPDFTLTAAGYSADNTAHEYDGAGFQRKGETSCRKEIPMGLNAAGNPPLCRP